jgi:hypothetical protein
MGSSQTTKEGLRRERAAMPTAGAARPEKAWGKRAAKRRGQAHGVHELAHALALLGAREARVLVQGLADDGLDGHARVERRLGV